MKIYRDLFSYSNETMPEILGSLKIYQQVEFIEEYLLEKNIFRIDSVIVCKKPYKVLPWAGYFPYDPQKHYVITFLFQFTSFWYYALYIIPLDLLIMCTMIHLGFQLNYLRKDLVSTLNKIQTIF